MRALAWRRAVLVAMLLGCAALGLGSTCDNRDFSGVLGLELAGTGTDSVVRAWRLPYDGRVALDFGITNEGSSDAAFEIVAQVQTSGDPSLLACERASGGTGREVAAAIVPLAPVGAGDAEEIPLLRALDTHYTITLPGDGNRGALRFVPGDASQFVFHTSDAGLRLDVQTLSGALVQPDDVSDTGSSCDELATSWTFTLDDATYLLVVDGAAAQSDSFSLVADRTCGAERRVDRTCPGTHSEVQQRVTGLRPPGGFESGRVSSELLGVGDIVVVEFACAEGFPGCRGNLDLFVLIEQLDCRQDRDCASAEVCAESGYCVSTGESGCSATEPGRGNAGGVLALGLLLAAILACGRGRSGVAAALLFMTVSLSGVPQARAADSGRVQVYVQPMVSTQSFTGRVGQYSSGSLGMHLMQGLQFGRLGAFVSLGSDYYLTNQPPPPYTRGLQTFEVAGGARISWLFGSMRVIAGAEYVNLGVVSNALNRFTGSALSFNGVGSHGGVRWEGFLPFYLEAVTTTRLMVDMERPTFSYGLRLALGMAGFI